MFPTVYPAKVLNNTYQQKRWYCNARIMKADLVAI